MKPTPSGKFLYAIAYEYRVRVGVWKPDIIYLHAKDDGDARIQFFQSESQVKWRHMRIVGIAPVIGFHVNDSKGDNLSV